MAAGKVADANGPVTSETPYRAGACVFYYREPEAEVEIPFKETIVYEDEHLLVVDKPHFLPVVPAGRFLHESLLVRLRAHGQPEALTPIHRLDRETAGVVLFSRNSDTRGLYTKLFRQRQVEKIYEALAPAPEDRFGFPLVRRSCIVRGEPFFRMEEMDAPPNAETSIEFVERGEAGMARYRLSPLTGKKHQLRLHMAALGIPILNDRLYPVYKRDADDFSRPLQLVARSIAFRDPVSGRELFFQSARELEL